METHRQKYWEIVCIKNIEGWNDILSEYVSDCDWSIYRKDCLLCANKQYCFMLKTGTRPPHLWLMHRMLGYEVQCLQMCHELFWRVMTLKQHLNFSNFVTKSHYCIILDALELVCSKSGLAKVSRENLTLTICVPNFHQVLWWIVIILANVCLLF